jgi:predicted ATPase
VTLAGPGGSGKTRIALQIAADLLDGSGDGVWFVDLSATLADEQVAGEVAAVVAVREVGTRPLLETLADALEFRDILLVLDNCEHVVDGCAKLAETLVRQCPKVWILTTSREPLAVAGERVYRVPPMGLPDVDGSTADPEALAASEAVRLFVERAKQHQPDFSLDAANADTVASICQHLDGIPLALELAAARLRSMSIEEVEGHLGQRFRLLSSRSRTASARQQTLGETLAWSYALLNDAERMVFACLAVFPSTFDLAAASAVCAEAASLDEFDVVDLIESLVDKSLLQTEQSAGALRYRMLETIAQYAAERLADGGEQAGTRAREAHAFHYLAYVERVAPHLGGADQAEWMVRMQTEYDGIRTALSFLAESPAHGPEALRMVGLLRDFWWAGLGGAQEEARELASAALAHPRAQAPTEDRARALASLGLLQITVGEVDDARVTHEEGLAIAREIDDGALASEHLSELSFVLFRLGDYVGAKESASLAVELADAAAEMDLQALARNCLGVAESADDPASAQANYLEALRLYEQLGNSRFTSMLYSNLAGHYTTAGDYAAARAMIDAAVAHAVTPDTRASAVLGLGTIALLEGDIATAESHHRDALRQLVHCGLFMWVPGALLGLAMCARASGQAERSAVLYGATDAMAEAQKIAWDTDDLSIRGDNIVALQQQMGEAFNLAYSRGSHMSRRDAIAFALDSRALDPAL